MTRDIVVVGASAGGVEALQKVVAEVPADLRAAVFVVLHVNAEGTSALPAILRRAGPLPAHHAINGESISYGRIYVAPPDYHMLLRDGVVRVVHGPRENQSRPAVDPLFRSAAIAYGERVIGVVLSGARDDGAAGLQSVKSRGGLAIIQDADDALVPGMPRSALEYVSADHICPAAKVGALIGALTAEQVTDRVPPPSIRMVDEANIAVLDPGTMEDDDKYESQPSPFTCRECHGTLWELADGARFRYRCRVGHAYSADSMVVEQEQSTERALWAALRSLEERAALSRRLSRHARGRAHDDVARRFDERAAEAESHALSVRRLLLAERGEAVAE
jgi:two-component system, chemotaxis family, protein-glutamate methylesterase/glutaminase